MFKRILTGVLASVMIIGSVLPVAAAESERTAELSEELNIVDEQILEYGSSFETATSVIFGSTYSGELPEKGWYYKDRRPWYKLTLSETGILKISGSITGRTEVAIYDKEANVIKSKCFYPNDYLEKTNYSFDYYLNSGDYWIALYTWENVPSLYTIKYEKISSNESIQEKDWGSNETMATASPISLNKTYYGQMSNNEKCDYYRFTTTKAETINISGTAFVEGHVFMAIYDERGNAVDSFSKFYNSITNRADFDKNIDIPGKGNYYLYIYRVTGNYDGYVYNFKISSKNASNPIESSSIKSLTVKNLTASGKALKPSFTVKDPSGKIISSSNYTYTVYPSTVKKVGKYTLTVNGKGSYKGTLKKTFNVVPKGTSISSLTAKKGGFTVKLKSQTIDTKGYQVQICTSKAFNGSTLETENINSNKSLNTTFSGYGSGKTYYVRVRTFQTVGSQKFYSAWSSVKTVKTK